MLTQAGPKVGKKPARVYVRLPIFKIYEVDIVAIINFKIYIQQGYKKASHKCFSEKSAVFLYICMSRFLLQQIIYTCQVI